VRALQAVVIVMGVVIVVGFAALFVTWGQRHLASAPAPAAAPRVVEQAPDVRVPIPEGARVVDVSPGGAFVDVLVENPDGTRDVLTVRRADGAVAGTLRFRPAAP
jgi:DNA-binding beta-propeller fold protein YncE